MISCFCWTTSFIINSIYFLWIVNFQKHYYLEYICTFWGLTPLYIVTTSLLVEETAVPRENHWPVASHWQTLSLKVISNIENTSPWAGFKLTSLVVIGTDCTGSCKSNYHTITTTMAHYVHLILHFQHLIELHTI